MCTTKNRTVWVCSLSLKEGADKTKSSHVLILTKYRPSVYVDKENLNGLGKATYGSRMCMFLCVCFFSSRADQKE